MNGLSNASFKNVFINNSMGSIMGSQTETVRDIHCSSLITEQISTGGAMRFLSPIAAQLKNTFISTVTSGTVATSSLFTTQITTGYPEYYSTVNPSTPWLLTSSFTLNTPPLTVTKGLGTYFDEASIVASMNQTTYYSIINPLAQTKQFLSTPYVNSIAGTGTPGVLVSGQTAARAPLGSELSPAATDSAGAVYVGSKDLGWKIQKITPSGTISTVAGNYRYFYGDGQTPFAAAFGPQLAVSVSLQSGVLITDISNVRIRTFTADPYVQTIAGTGVASYSGDGGPAYLATFSTPTATATDMSGYIYVADRWNHILRRISGSTITTFAGTPGVAGQGGDGGPATAATLGNPYGIATDLSNTIYFTDISACVIRQVTPAGGISLVAGTYVPGFGGDGGPATTAYLSTPRSIAVDLNRNIYFCDTGNSRVRRIDAATQEIRTIAGNGVSAYRGDGGLAVNASLSTPTGVAIDGNGNVYISDTNNQCIRYVDMGTNIIRTVAGRPQRPGTTGDYSFATFALLNSPSHIAFDRNTGYLYIADEGNCRIRYVDPAMNIIYPFAGNGSPLFTGDGGQASAAVFGTIRCLSMGAGNTLYVVDDTAHMIRAINLATGMIDRVAGTGVAGFSGEGAAATLANLSSPQTLVTDSSAHLYFTDRDNQRIRTITPAGIISTLAGTGVAGYSGDGFSSIYATLNTPTALAIDAASRTLYVGDLTNNRIRALNASNIITTYAGSGDYGAPTEGRSFASTMLASTTSIAVDSNAQVYFTEVVTHGVWRLNQGTNTVQAMSLLSTGAYLGDPGPLSSAYFNTPTGLSVDPSGNFLISDAGNSRLRCTYTYGYPQTPVYLTMNFTYTNYFASTGTTSIALNGNTLTTFYGSNLYTTSYQLSNANIYTYPLQGSNPVFGDQTPYVQITQTDTYGYTKLDGTLYAQEVLSQGELQNSVDSTTGLIMNSGALIFPKQNNGITIDNRFNDASLRTIVYTGQLLAASDPALKEEIEPANTSLCYSTMAQLPLKRYAYSEPYVSTFRVKDMHRLGYLTTDVAPFFPQSVERLACDEHTWMSSTRGLDTTQLRFAHYGVTQHLMGLVSTLESEVEELARSIVAQRNTIL
jgi:sugar lactone lactonase YvrE